MTIFQYLRMRFTIWRLEQVIAARAESKQYHEYLSELALGIADRDRRILKEASQELERINTALSQGVAV